MRQPLAALVVLSVLVVGGCASNPDAGEEATGIVVEVEGELEDVEGFTILVDGERMAFRTSPEGDYAFPLGHLQDHLRSGEPVLVRWEERDGQRVATFINDA